MPVRKKMAAVSLNEPRRSEGFAGMKTLKTKKEEDWLELEMSESKIW